MVLPDGPVVFGGVLLFEGQHVSQSFGGLNHQAFHFVIRDSAVAWIVEDRRVFAGVEVFEEAVAKGVGGEGICFVAEGEFLRGNRGGDLGDSLGFLGG